MRETKLKEENLDTFSVYGYLFGGTGQWVFNFRIQHKKNQRRGENFLPALSYVKKGPEQSLNCPGFYPLW